MHLSIPTDWTEALLLGIKSLPVRELYGTLPITVTGSGRASKILPRVTREIASAHVQAAGERGIGFNYLLNGPCLGNKESIPSFREALFTHLDWIARMGAESVTVANLFVFDFVKTHFPSLRIKTSIFMAPPNLPTLCRLHRSGADAITLRQGDNRRFDYLKQIKLVSNGEVWLLANVACAHDCPALVYHANAGGHDSQEGCEAGAGPNTYPILRCTAHKLSHAASLLKARWIRPEDISDYEEMGYRLFKLAGRDAPTDWILNAARAYSNRRYDGNLAEILDGFHYLDEWQRRAGNIPFEMPYIDNTKLNGFIHHFESGLCDDLCDTCGYCEAVSRTTVTLHKSVNQSFIDVIDAYAASKRFY